VVAVPEKAKNQKQPHRDKKNKCGATAKSTGEPCKLPAGFGTDHLGEGKCKYHGGASKGPGEKNKNAVQTHEHETIWLDTLDDDERKHFEEMRTDVLDQLDEEIKLTNIRIRRMMKRIAKLAKLDYSTVEKKYRNGVGPEGPVDIEESKELATMGQIQDIEEALTRVQRQKEKLLKLKHTIEEGGDDDEEKLNQVVSAMMKVAGG